MPRTPLLDALSRLARDHEVARRAGVDPREIREVRAARRFTRREVLTAAAAGAALAALPKAARASIRPRVVVVGAGIAGVTAALTLRDYGIASTVYEASGRIGGRMHSNTKYWDDGQVTEWCGELIDSGHTTVRSLARRFGIKLYDVHAGEPEGSTDTYFFDGAYYSAAQADADFAPVLAAVTADADAAGYPTTWNRHNAAGLALDAMSVYDWIESRVPGGHASAFGKMLDVAYATEYGADTRGQSALNLVYLLAYQPDAPGFHAFGVSDERSRIVGGNQRLPTAIARHLGDAVRFGRRLESVVRTAGGRYELTFDDVDGIETVVADVVVLALPFAVLRGLDYARAGFDDRKRLAIDALGRGHNGKLQLQFRAKSWQRPGPYPKPANGASYADAGYQQTWDASRSQHGDSGLLNDYTGGGVTDSMTATHAFGRVESAGVQADASQALARIERVYPGVTADWNGKATSSLPHKSPNLQCSYSYWKTGQYRTIAGYERVRQGDVHFAGEHTSVDFQGFMEGGASSGVRAALEIVAALR